MSAGSSSQVVACFSVDRTKYLMLSKSISSSPAPQCGIGLRSKIRNAFSRASSIQAGSSFLPEMSATIASDRPRWATAPAASESTQP